jgi:hypothetical protein
MSWTSQLNRLLVSAQATCGGVATRDRFQEPDMRQRILKALTYPRILVMSNLDGEECLQNLNFNPEQEACQRCEQGEACHWLNCNDELTVVSKKPMATLYESLLFCIDYVDAHCTHASHNVRRCACESCHWVRSAHRIASDYRYVRRSH